MYDLTGHIPPNISKIHSQMRKASDEMDRLANKQFKEIGRAVRQDVIIPFCDRIDCDFETSNGSWAFYLRYPLPHRRTLYWAVGHERRQLPSAPNDLSSDEDCWWAEITDEELRIAEVLDSYPPWATGRLSWHVDPYTRK